MQKVFDTFLNIVIIVSIVLIIYLLFFNSKQPTLTEKTSSSVQENSVYFEKLPDPIQTPYRNNDFITFTDKDIDLKIYPKAYYRIYAMVMSKKRYRFGWESKISPYDLALAWNKLTYPENQKGIRYSQRNRWYYFHYDGGYPLSKSYIYKHSANSHIIPANENLKKALDSIRKKDKIYLEGYLVYIKGKVKNRDVWWKSSLSRKDQGDGACEVFYITKAVVENKSYQ